MKSQVKHNLPKGAWLVVAFLFVVGALNYIDRNMLTTMRTSIVNSIPMTDAQFGLLTSVFLWIYGLLSPVAGYVADKFKRSYVVIFSLIVWSVVTWLTGHATNYNQLLVSRALMGISEAFYIPAALAMIVDYHKGPTQSLATGINLAGVMIGSSLGFVGGWIAETYTWNLAFNGFGIVGVVYAIILIFFLKDAPKDDVIVETDKSKKQSNSNVSISDAFKSLFSRPSYVFLLIFWGILGVVSWMIVAWLPTYYKEQFNLSQTLAGFYATAYLYPASIVGLLLGGFLSDRWSKKTSHARIYIPIIGLAIAAPAIFLASYSSVLYLTIVFFMIYGLTSKFTDTNMMPMLCLIADDRYLATGYGILNMFSTIIGGLGIYAAGALRDSQVNLSLIYQIAAISILIGIILLFFIKNNIQKQKINYEQEDFRK